MGNKQSHHHHQQHQHDDHHQIDQDGRVPSRIIRRTLKSSLSSPKTQMRSNLKPFDLPLPSTTSSTMNDGDSHHHLSSPHSMYDADTLSTVYHDARSVINSPDFDDSSFGEFGRSMVNSMSNNLLDEIQLELDSTPIHMGQVRFRL